MYKMHKNARNFLLKMTTRQNSAGGRRPQGVEGHERGEAFPPLQKVKGYKTMNKHTMGENNR